MLAPTRELALQIDSVAKIFRQHVSSVTAYGGAPRMNQEMLLRQNPDICIATPGRLLDFARNGIVNLKNCSYVVLDEADRMLDMGFEPQIREVIDYTPVSELFLQINNANSTLAVVELTFQQLKMFAR